MSAQKRSYNADSRQAQAQKNKERILATAQKLFESKGFTKVTIEQIAQKAEVSVPSIYAIFKSKIGILRELIDTALPSTEREALIHRAKTEKSPKERLRITAAITRQLYDAEHAQLGLLQHAAILDPLFKKLQQEREQRRYKRLEESMNIMAQEKGFAKDLTTSQAHDILWAFTGRDLYRLLVIERGWSSNDYEKWLGNTLVKALLK
ncbi:MAG: TetR/AcrR family transcriptional regulator [Candidatus Babeliales bacterium]